MQNKNAPVKSLSLAIISQIMQELSRIDLRSIDPQNPNLALLRKKTKLLCKGYTHTSVMLSPEWGKFHRAIQYEDRPIYVKNLHHPPESITKLGRANFPKNPLFYCSGNPKATFFELELNPGDTIVLSKWTLIDEVLLFPIGYSDCTFKNLNSNRACPIIIPHGNRHPQEFTKSNIRITDFLNEKFTQIISKGNEHLYWLTATIADFFLQTQPDCGIVYPSISVHANAENIAFTPRAVNLHLKPASASWYKINRVENFSYSVTLLTYADSFADNGEINWRSPTEEERYYL